MLVTLDGIVTDVSPLQPENARSPMFVTLDGIVTDVNPLQSENATSNTSSPMLVTPSAIVNFAPAGKVMPQRVPGRVAEFMWLFVHDCGYSFAA